MQELLDKLVEGSRRLDALEAMLNKNRRERLDSHVDRMWANRESNAPLEIAYRKSIITAVMCHLEIERLTAPMPSHMLDE